MKKRVIIPEELHFASASCGFECHKRWHNANIEVITEVTTSLVIKEQKYIRVFGELIPISEEELRAHSTLIIEN